LITHTSGDFDEAIDCLRELDKEYKLTTAQLRKWESSWFIPRWGWRLPSWIWRCKWRLSWRRIF